MGTKELWTKSWAVNTVGTQIMTETFVPLLLKSEDPRLLFLASGTSSLAVTQNPDFHLNKSPAKGWPKDKTAGPSFAAYRSSKAGMNMMMR
jgi:NAD(P)-dependent dehydrogenase (short-subunit alcohol dehydrogenase family)